MNRKKHLNNNNMNKNNNNNNSNNNNKILEELWNKIIQCFIKHKSTHYPSKYREEEENNIDLLIYIYIQ